MKESSPLGGRCYDPRQRMFAFQGIWTVNNNGHKYSFQFSHWYTLCLFMKDMPKNCTYIYNQVNDLKVVTCGFILNIQYPYGVNLLMVWNLLNQIKAPCWIRFQLLGVNHASAYGHTVNLTKHRLYFKARQMKKWKSCAFETQLWSSWKWRRISKTNNFCHQTYL